MKIPVIACCKNIFDRFERKRAHLGHSLFHATSMEDLKGYSQIVALPTISLGEHTAKSINLRETVKGWPWMHVMDDLTATSLRPAGRVTVFDLYNEEGSFEIDDEGPGFWSLVVDDGTECAGWVVSDKMLLKIRDKITELAEEME
jgi:hypothetical protein